MLTVNHSQIPPRNDYDAYVDRIWENQQLTNNGPLVQEFEQTIKAHLGAKHVFAVSNGTIALHLAIRALGLKGEIITSAFGFVATCSSIVWEGCTPVFADINPATLSIDPESIKQQITSKTVAIMPTHLYGQCCDVEAIKKIADEHGLAVIYDGAHAMGSIYKGQQVLGMGTIDMVSFQAYKILSCGDGGALVTNDDAIAQQILQLRYFGMDMSNTIQSIGTNAKMSEQHAAMGLANYRHFNTELTARAANAKLYDELLQPLPISRPVLEDGAISNNAYYTLLFENEETLLRVQNHLLANDVVTRRYFYPALTAVPYIVSPSKPIAERVTRVCLCLPIHRAITATDVAYIVELIQQAIY